MPDDLSAAFAARILAIDHAALDAADREQLARLVFDVATCAWGGTRQETVAALVRWAGPDGSARTERVLDSRGTPAHPFTWEQLREKARALTGACRPPLDLDLLREAAQGLSQASDVRLLDRLLTGAPSASHAAQPA